MSLIEITTYLPETTEDTDPLERMRGVERDTTCGLCDKPFCIGEAVIAYDCFEAKTLIVWHYHPSCLEVLVTVGLQDMAKLVDEKGFVLGKYIAKRRGRVTAALDTVMLAGTVQLPADIVR